MTKLSGRVLIVDDSHTTRVLLSSFVTSLGYECVLAVDGEDALEAVRRQAPDVVLLDLILPGIDGLQVLLTLKNDAALHNIPVLIISTVDEQSRVVECIAAGAEDYLFKPFDPVLLKARIGACLERKRLHDRQEMYRLQVEEANRTLALRVREQVREITRSHLSTIFALAKLAESRDTDTGRHLLRIREYCRVLCERLRERGTHGREIDDEFVEDLYVTAPLHDIGKVGIPDSILLKPGPLTPEELAVMRTHTTIGAATLGDVASQHPGNRLLLTAVDVAQSHHERWDGTGYPSGIRGEAIPLAARIVAIADVYDALITKRPYKPAFSHEVSRQEILAARGTQFDPELVEAFLAREQAFAAIHAGHPDVTAGDAR